MREWGQVVDRWLGVSVPCTASSIAHSPTPLPNLPQAPAPAAALAGEEHARQREALLQQMARVEMKREAERAARLAACDSDGDRRRLATLYELERQQAMHLMQQLSA